MTNEYGADNFNRTALLLAHELGDHVEGVGRHLQSHVSIVAGSRVCATRNGHAALLTALKTAVRAFGEVDVALYDGRLFEASWWTRNQTPGETWGPWQEIATAPDGTAIWTPSRIFDTGDVALYEGVTYRARWWNRNQPPTASPWGPWERIG